MLVNPNSSTSANEGSCTDPPLLVELDLDALTHNVRVIQDLAGPGRHLIAAIKANAYGHGCVPVAQCLQSLGVHSLATGSLAEALEIRAAGVRLPILLFAASVPTQLPELAAAGFVPTVTSLEAAQYLSASAAQDVPIYIKVDAGLGRLGIPIAGALEIIERIHALPNLRLDGLYTHTPFANELGREWATEKLREFNALCANLRARGLQLPVTQAGASSCLLAGLEDQCNAVCVGHALYGLSPYARSEPFSASLKSVFKSLKTRLIQVVHHGQGADIGIAKLYGIERAKTIGVLAVGLGNGVTRPTPGSNATVIVNGMHARVLAVSLEHTTIELANDVSAAVGDEVVLIGAQGRQHIDLETFASWRNASPLEALMHLSGR
ncbi:MAG: alanine racemase [Gammaproteobacteria bacterium]|jgi:alanine racemase